MLRCATGCTLALLTAVTLLPSASFAQTPASGLDRLSAEKLMAEGRKALAAARTSPDGLKFTILQKDPNHYAEVVGRVKTGGAEVHADWDDIILMLDGQASELTGGTVIDGKDTGNGEVRGARVDGGTPNVLHKGDLLQVPAGLPHQMIVPAGKTVIYYVIKVQKPR